jgi:nucleotide-binding universal stress UspA family protein
MTDRPGLSEEPTMIPIYTILFPTDFSRRSRYAFRMATALARDYGSRLIVLHVERDQEQPAGSHDSLAGHDVNEASRRDSREWLHRLCDSARRVLIEGRTVVSSAAEEILRVADESNCDLIVMGTHGRRGLARMLEGSVTEEVMRRASCPIVAVRAPVPVLNSPEGNHPVASRTTDVPATAQSACQCGHPRRTVIGEVVISHNVCDCTGCHATRVHHRAFPQIIGEGTSVAEAAEQLIRQLVRTRDNVREGWPRQNIDQSIADVEEFRESLSNHEHPWVHDRGAVHLAKVHAQVAPPPLSEAIP